MQAITELEEFSFNNFDPEHEDNTDEDHSGCGETVCAIYNWETIHSILLSIQGDMYDDRESNGGEPVSLVEGAIGGGHAGSDDMNDGTPSAGGMETGGKQGSKKRSCPASSSAVELKKNKQ